MYTDNYSPGQSVTLPGQSVTLPGQSVTLHGPTVTSPGPTVTFPGPTVNVVVSHINVAWLHNRFQGGRNALDLGYPLPTINSRPRGNKVSRPLRRVGRRLVYAPP